MKKMFGVFIFGILLVSMMGIASAGPVEDFVKGVNTVGDGIFNILKPVLEILTGESADTGIAGEDFLAKALFLVIIFTIIWLTLSKVDFFNENNWVLWVISLSASILAIRWLGGSGVIKTIILPYSALGIAITAGLPLVLAFLIIENNFNKTMRKFSWIFFMVIFIGLWFTRYEEITKMANGGFVYTYLIVAMLAFIIMIMDGTVQRWLNKTRRERGQLPEIRKQIIKLEDEKEILNARYTKMGDAYTGHSKLIGFKGWRKDIDSLDKRIANLENRT
jgi:hypothetical protein